MYKYPYTSVCLNTTSRLATDRARGQPRIPYYISQVTILETAGGQPGCLTTSGAEIRRQMFKLMKSEFYLLESGNSVSCQPRMYSSCVGLYISI